MCDVILSAYTCMLMHTDTLPCAHKHAHPSTCTRRRLCKETIDTIAVCTVLLCCGLLARYTRIVFMYSRTGLYAILHTFPGLTSQHHSKHCCQRPKNELKSIDIHANRQHTAYYYRFYVLEMVVIHAIYVYCKAYMQHSSYRLVCFVYSAHTRSSSLYSSRI